ncbi:MAG: M20 family metallo-hydrolase [Flavobacteriales bacterium]|nr:M20 family metallo-hydrolase [Flavobacteriales bacterium]
MSLHSDLKKAAIALLQDLIRTQSFSTEEDLTAALIEKWLTGYTIPFKRQGNNIYAFNKHFDPSKPNLLLNSHHDTVKPNSNYTRDPFDASIEDGKLYGLGSNDAGGCLVSLLATFVYFYDRELANYNLVIAATAEEEISGPNGLNSLLETLPEIEVAIVGEPTKMDLAIAEKGLLVFDATVNGTASHAAHPNDDNPIYKAIETLEFFRDFKFEKVSETLGEVKLTVTQINAGKQHNVVPGSTELVIDCRVNDKYTNAEIVKILKEKAPCELKPRSTRLNSSSISINHPLVQAGIALGKDTYGSPTVSDQSVLSCQSLKMGPGDSLRSHSADEFIYVNEIEEGIETYIELLSKVL